MAMIVASASKDKEECFFCGTEADSKDGEFIEVQTIDQLENNTGLQIQLARWGCNACITEYKELMKNES